MTTPQSDRPDPGPRVTPSPLPPSQDHDIATGLALRSITRALTILGATTVGVGLVAAGAASMAQVENGGAGTEIVVPGLVVLMVGQVVSLVATGLTTWALVRLLRRRVPVPAHAVTGLSRGLGLLSRALVAGLVIAVAASVVLRPGAWLAAVLGAVVALQVSVVIGVVRGNVLRPRA